MAFEPIETWALEGDLRALLEAIRFETDHIEITDRDGEALLESTKASGTYGHIAVLHRREAVGGVETDLDCSDPLRVSFQHESTPRTESVQRALTPFRQETIRH